MNTRISNAKKHLVENKAVYTTGVVVGSTCLGVGTYVGFRLGYTQGTLSAAEVVQKVAQSATTIASYKPVINQTLYNFIERSTPSKIVALMSEDGETIKQAFSSIHEAARATGHAVGRISKNVNGHIPSVGGDVFKIIVPEV